MKDLQNYFEYVKAIEKEQKMREILEHLSPQEIYALYKEEI